MRVLIENQLMIEHREYDTTNGKLEDNVSRIKNTLIFAQSKINWA